MLAIFALALLATVVLLQLNGLRVWQKYAGSDLLLEVQARNSQACDAVSHFTALPCWRTARLHARVCAEARRIAIRYQHRAAATKDEVDV